MLSKCGANDEYFVGCPIVVQVCVLVLHACCAADLRCTEAATTALGRVASGNYTALVASSIDGCGICGVHVQL